MPVTLRNIQGGELVSLTDNGILLHVEPGAISFERQGEHLVIATPGGDRVEVSNFFLAEESELPVVSLPGGAQVSGAVFLTALDPDFDVSTAAGPAASPDGSGAGDYSDDAGELLDGLGGVGKLGSDAGGAAQWNSEREPAAIGSSLPGRDVPGEGGGGGAASGGGSGAPGGGSNVSSGGSDISGGGDSVSGGKEGPPKPPADSADPFGYGYRAVMYLRELAVTDEASPADYALSIPVYANGLPLSAGDIGFVVFNGEVVGRGEGKQSVYVSLPEGLDDLAAVSLANGQLLISLTEEGCARLRDLDGGETLLHYLRIQPESAKESYGLQLVLHTGDSFDSQVQDAASSDAFYLEDTGILVEHHYAKGQGSESFDINPSKGQNHFDFNTGVTGTTLADTAAQHGGTFHFAGGVDTSAGNNALTLGNYAIHLGSETSQHGLSATAGGVNSINGLGSSSLSFEKGMLAEGDVNSGTKNSIQDVASVVFESGRMAAGQYRKDGVNEIRNVEGMVVFKDGGLTATDYGKNSISDIGGLEITSSYTALNASRHAAGTPDNRITGIKGDATITVTAGVDIAFPYTSGVSAGRNSGNFLSVSGDGEIVMRVVSDGKEKTLGLTSVNVGNNVFRTESGDISLYVEATTGRAQGMQVEGGFGTANTLDSGGNIRIGVIASEGDATGVGAAVINNSAGRNTLLAQGDIHLKAAGLNSSYALCSMQQSSKIELTAGEGSIFLSAGSFADSEGKVDAYGVAYGSYSFGYSGESDIKTTLAAGKDIVIKSGTKLVFDASAPADTGDAYAVYGFSNSYNARKNTTELTAPGSIELQASAQAVFESGGHNGTANAYGMYAKNWYTGNGVRSPVTENILKSGEEITVLAESRVVLSQDFPDSGASLAAGAGNAYGLYAVSNTGSVAKNSIAALDGFVPGAEGMGIVVSITAKAGIFDALGREIPGASLGGNYGKSYAMYAEGKGAGNQISGSAGNDTVTLAGDIYSDGNGTNLIDAGAGDDIVSLHGAVARNTVIKGGEGTDTLVLMAADVETFNSYYKAWLEKTDIIGMGFEKWEVTLTHADGFDYGRLSWLEDRIGFAPELRLSGGEGDSVFTFQSGFAGLALDGGDGTDVLRLLATGEEAHREIGAFLDGNRIENMDSLLVDMKGNGGVDALDLDALLSAASNAPREIFITADTTDTITAGSGNGWEQKGQVTVNEVVYNTWTNGDEQTVYLEQEIILNFI